jgi:hypothetical protein
MFEWLPWRLSRRLKAEQAYSANLRGEVDKLKGDMEALLLALQETQKPLPVRYNVKFTEGRVRNALRVIGHLVPRQVSYQIAVPLVELQLSKNDKMLQIRAGLIRNMVDDGMRLIQEDLLRQVQEMDGGRKQRQA